MHFREALVARILIVQKKRSQLRRLMPRIEDRSKPAYPSLGTPAIKLFVPLRILLANHHGNEKCVACRAPASGHSCKEDRLSNISLSTPVFLSKGTRQSWWSGAPEEKTNTWEACSFSYASWPLRFEPVNAIVRRRNASVSMFTWVDGMSGLCSIKPAVRRTEIAARTCSGATPGNERSIC